MKQRIGWTFISFFIALMLLAWTLPAKAQVAENSALFKTVMELDRQLFDEGFNQCKLDRFEKLAAPDLEFFHDKGGRQNRAEFLQASRTNICGNPNSRPVRTLLPGSTQIFPLENKGVLYGAIQQGVHRFHTKGQDPQKHGYTDAKFNHVWILNKGVWQLKTALSFDHQSKAPGTAKPLAVKAKKEPEPYTIYDLTLLGHSLRLDYRAGME
jgi:Domain of unknown function (DUF4440)